MELRDAEAVVALAEELNFGRAARRVHISQAPLSRRLRRLEDELGVALFCRSKHRVTLTAAGEAFVSEARQLLAAAQRASAVVRPFARGQGEALPCVVGAVELGISAVVPLLLSAFSVRKGGRSRSVARVRHLIHCSEIWDGLEKGDLDAGIAYDPPSASAEAAGIAAVQILRFERGLVLPANHRLVSCRRIRLSDLDGEEEDPPFIFVDPAVAPRQRQAMIDYCRACGLEPRTGPDATLFSVGASYAAAGLGILLADPLHFRANPRPGLVYRPIAGERVTTSLWFGWRKFKDHTTHQPDVLARLVSTARTLSDAGQRVAIER